MQDKSDNERLVDEIMGLVDDIIGCDSAGYQFECKREIQSRLHELTGNLPEGYDGSVMSGNVVHIHFDTQDNACKWYESFTDTVDAMKFTGRS